MNLRHPHRGQMLLQTLIFSTVAIMILGALVNWVIYIIRINVRTQSQNQAEQIAEAGIEYYRWHLAHASNDYQDGTGHAGPYTHAYYDKDGNQIGQFILTITPPPIGSTIVTILSAGSVTNTPGVTEKVEVKTAIPSLAKYAVASNSDVRFGTGTEVFGPIHANGGVHFDGLAHNIVTSAVSTYTDPDHSGGSEYAVHTHLSPTDPSPPTTLPSRPDVFEAGRQFPVPVIDFTGFTTDLSQIKTNAQASGRYIANSGAQGYRIVLKTNDTFDLYRVNSLYPTPLLCSNSQSQSGWGMWSIGTSGGAQTFIANYAFPGNGLIFVEDNLWVEGQINGARLTIASARFPDNPATRTSITVNSDLTYTNYDGTDVLSMIAQNNFNVGYVSDDNLRIDGAIIAQNGRVGRFYYPPLTCLLYASRSVLTLYGMIGSNQRYGFAYTDGTGYDQRDIIYDANLLYGPPPSFPLTSSQYTIISWKRVK